MAVVYSFVAFSPPRHFPRFLQKQLPAELQYPASLCMSWNKSRELDFSSVDRGYRKTLGSLPLCSDWASMPWAYLVGFTFRLDVNGFDTS